MTSPRSTGRSARSSELAVDALTKPFNVVVPAAVAVAGVLTGAVWLVLVALVGWIGLAAAAFLEARRVPPPVPATYAPPIARRVRAAVAAQVSIRAAIAGSTSPLVDVAAEVDALVAAMQADAGRAQRIHEFLVAEPPDALERRIAREPDGAVRAALEAKVDAVARLRARLDRLLAELDHVVVTLQTVQAEILATDGLDDRALAGQVSEVRVNAQLIAAGLEEAFAETRSFGV
ncbi:MAG TPA: hypothetical protein VFG79_01355 [Solirubrobacter sp.]|nr:hypothetical protein [Solirubrobacter sp.]